MAQEHADENGHDDHEEHDHGTLTFQGTDVPADLLAQIKETNASLAGLLEMTTRWSELTEAEKKEAALTQIIVEKSEGWTPGFFAEGDMCAACGKATAPIFTDRFESGKIVYGPFLRGLPVHPTKACLDGFSAKVKDVSPRGLDKARRALTRDLDRPSPKMTQFFRHDILAHPPFSLEDWANSVAEAQKEEGLGKGAMKDIERLLRWVHQRMFHHH